MNLVVHHPDVLIGARGVPSAWRHEGAALVIGAGEGTHGGDVRIWPAADWRELVALWSAGLTAPQINARFCERGYGPEDVRRLRALILGTDTILPPLDRAIFVLSGYARRDDRAASGFELFDRPVRACEIVEAANKILGTLALPLIRYPNAFAGGAA